MAKITALTQDLCRYILRSRTAEDPVLASLRRETRQFASEMAGMMVSEEQGVLLRVLTAAMAPRLAVEVGTFTGYSALCIAQGLPAGGRLLCCEISDEWASIALRHWERAKVNDRIDLRIAPALETLSDLPEDSEIDLAFLDADKDNYVAYYEALLPRMRTNGLIAADNVLWHNWAMDAANQDAETIGIRAFNDYVLGDPRVETVMLHVGDGLSLVRKL